MEARRSRFLLAFVGFLAWVATLAALAAYSARENRTSARQESVRELKR